jgi:hypothetical protein
MRRRKNDSTLSEFQAEERNSTGKVGIAAGNRSEERIMPVELLWAVPAAIVVGGGLYLLFPVAWTGKKM